MENREVLINNEEFKERNYAHAYASFGTRAIAFIIDMMVVGGLNKIITGIIGLDPELSFYGFAMTDILSWAITLGYFTLASLITKGQSLGKMITGIRVVSLTSDKLDLGQILIREIAGRFIQNTIMLVYLLSIFTPKKQGLIDFFVDTAVVKEDAFRDLYGVDFR